MPEIVGRLRPPRLATAPSSPAGGEEYYDTGGNTLCWWNGTVWVVSGGATAGALPASPIDGQECYYLADATNGIVWHLKYRAGSASTHKWEFLGGSELIAGPSGSVTTSSTTPVAFSGGPSITLPLAGDYEVLIGAAATIQVATGPVQLSTSSTRNGAVFGVSAIVVAGVQYTGGDAVKENVLANANAGDVVALAAQLSAAVSGVFNNGWIKLKPRRVG
jgi:hypothetical protein